MLGPFAVLQDELKTTKDHVQQVAALEKSISGQFSVSWPTQLLLSLVLVFFLTNQVLSSLFLILPLVSGFKVSQLAATLWQF